MPTGGKSVAKAAPAKEKPTEAPVTQEVASTDMPTGGKSKVVVAEDKHEVDPAEPSLLTTVYFDAFPVSGSSELNSAKSHKVIVSCRLHNTAKQQTDFDYTWKITSTIPSDSDDYGIEVVSPYEGTGNQGLLRTFPKSIPGTYSLACTVHQNGVNVTDISSSSNFEVK